MKDPSLRSGRSSGLVTFGHVFCAWFPESSGNPFLFGSSLTVVEIKDGTLLRKQIVES